MRYGRTRENAFAGREFVEAKCVHVTAESKSLIAPNEMVDAERVRQETKRKEWTTQRIE